MRVPSVDLGFENSRMQDELLSAMSKVLTSGDFTLGDEVRVFERDFASLQQSGFAVGTSSGTDALMLVMKSLRIGQDDEVITVSNSFVATVSSIVNCGARPVFADVGPDENIDPSQLEALITEHTKAILPVHLRGRPAAMDSITEIAKRHGLYVIEDCAQAVRARLDNRPVGTFGIAGCFSLHPLKNLGACGDAGIIITNDESLLSRLHLLRNHGLKTRDECVEWGFNARLDSIEAALLNVKLAYLDVWTERRREIARSYIEGLADLDIQLPIEGPGEYVVYYLFVIQLEQRDALLAFLQSRDIDARVHYPTPIHLQAAAVGLGYKSGDLPITEKQSRTMLSLPIYASLRDEHVAYVIEQVRNFFSGCCAR